jgi:hypothetical protein
VAAYFIAIKEVVQNSPLSRITDGIYHLEY